MAQNMVTYMVTYVCCDLFRNAESTHKVHKTKDMQNINHDHNITESY